MNTIEEALDVMPDDGPDEVAAFLVAQGARMVDYNYSQSCSCPVAVYLRASTSDRGITVGFDVVAVGGWSHCYNLKPSVSRFIQAFDQGGYPELAPTPA